MEKLIETALPLSAINARTIGEKTSARGRPENLHMWWGRSPVEATRTALLASLIDAPEDLEELGRRFERVEENCYAEQGTAPTVFDPFSGFGAVPLAAQMLGLPAIAGDLNPVAVMLTKAAAEIPSLFKNQRAVNPYSMNSSAYAGSQGLAEDVLFYGEWLRDQAETKLRPLYPGEPEGQPAAWIWARTVRCPNPACGCEMPLVSSYVINSKPANAAWMEPVIEQGRLRFVLHRGSCPAGRETNKVGTGGARFRCPACGEITTESYLKKAGKQHELGARMMAMLVDTPTGRIYQEATAAQEAAAEVPVPDDVPRGAIPDNGHWFSPPGFGLTEYEDLFSPRQMTMLTTFCELLTDVQNMAASDALSAGMASSGGSLSEGGSGALAYGQAVSIYLAFVIDKMADRNSTVCTWNSSGGNPRATFCRQAMPMAWNYAEGNPFSTITGNYTTALKNVTDAIRELPCGSGVSVYQGDAVQADFPKNVLVCTEIPYYRSIGYAHLSDYFYIWMRKSLRPVFPELFNSMVTPKEELTTVGQYYGRTQEACSQEYQQKLRKVVRKLYDCASRDFPALLFFEFRRADQAAIQTNAEAAAPTAWEEMIGSLVETGFAISAIWPMRTVRYTRTADSTRVLIVCRKLEKTERITRRGWITTLKRELPAKLKRAYHFGVDDVDQELAGMGCGLSVFTRFQNVINADGSDMCIRDALVIINQEIQEYIQVNMPYTEINGEETKEDASDEGKL